MKRIARLLQTALIPLALAWPPAGARGDEASEARRTRGHLLYQEHCARCHGEDGQGGGPDADETRKPVPDLTRLTIRNGGVFPEAKIMEIIDGRRVVRAHGPSGMPVWGKEFDPDVAAGPAEVAIRDKLRLLVEHLQSMQRAPSPPASEDGEEASEDEEEG